MLPRVLLLPLLLALDVTPLEASLVGPWRFHEGDGAFAAADVDDSVWTPVQVPGGLGQQGVDVDGVYWLRARLRFVPPQQELSVRLGPIDSAAEVYVDGVFVSSAGDVDDGVAAHERPTLFSLPLAAAADGDVVLAVRAWRAPWRLESAPARGGMTKGPSWLGATRDVVEAQLRRDALKGVAGPVVLVVALYHLQLFRRRRRDPSNLWFGLFSLAMSAHLLASTDACAFFFSGLTRSRLFWLSLLVTLPLFTQFLWPFLGKPVTRFWRVNQAAMSAYAVVATLWPTPWFVTRFMLWFELLLLLPLMIGTTLLVVRAAWAGNREARTLWPGILALVVAAGQNLVVERTMWPLPELMAPAMAVVVLNIAVSLANRYARVFQELDEKNAALVRLDRLNEEVRRLNAHVQVQVRVRSEDLARALEAMAQREAPSSLVGAVLDNRFSVERLLGKGGMGTVYAGRDVVTGADVAIKVIRAASAAEVDAVHRFLREARAAVSVDHPAIVRTLHVDVSADGLLYQVQELVHGKTLEQLVEEQGPLATGLVARAGSVLALGLAAAHARGVIHRDVKPSNVMATTAPPGLKLLDFGVAKIVGADDATGTGLHVGTPAYMAPEQRFVGGEAVSDRVDVYAFGVLLHRLATGSLVGEPRRAPLPAELAPLVEQCLQEEPSSRPSAADVAVALAQIADAHGVPEALALPGVTPPQSVTDLMRELVRTP